MKQQPCWIVKPQIVGAGRSRLGKPGSEAIRPRGVALKFGRSLYAQSPAIPLPWPLRRVGKAHLAASAPPTKKREGS